MNDKGDLAFIAALTSRMAQQQTATAALLSTLESTSADIVKGLESTATPDAIKGVMSAMNAIESALADVVTNLSAMTKREHTPADFGPLVEALRAINLTPQAMPAAAVTVNVEPTPVTVEAIMPPMPPMPPAQIHLLKSDAPSQIGATYEVELPSLYGGEPRKMIIKRTA